VVWSLSLLRLPGDDRISHNVSLVVAEGWWRSDATVLHHADQLGRLSLLRFVTTLICGNKADSLVFAKK
jgi:hypothetical protein